MLTTELFDKIEKSYTYPAYKQISINMAETGSTSGEQSKQHIEATVINAQRLKRIDKTTELNQELKDVLKHQKNHFKWILISEVWCGDSAQSVPIIAKMANENELIDLQIVFRDEHPELMNEFLTEGSRSIPKLICLNPLSYEVIGTWGPRPKSIISKIKEFKKTFPNASHDEFVNNLHLWYARDKTQSIQKEFVDLLSQWDKV